MGAKTPQTNVRLSEDGRALLAEMADKWKLDKGATVEKALAIAKAMKPKETPSGFTASIPLKVGDVVNDRGTLRIVRAPLLKPKGKIS